ncbi:hypothetical protein L210DRAFT_3351898, partial [Boletus edulis BED1]
PLVYIHWFKPLRQLDNAVGMFCVSRLTRHHQPNAAVIPADRLVQICHPIP